LFLVEVEVQGAKAMGHLGRKACSGEVAYSKKAACLEEEGRCVGDNREGDSGPFMLGRVRRG